MKDETMMLIIMTITIIAMILMPNGDKEKNKYNEDR